MILEYVVGIVSNIVWMLIPFRQVRTNYFFFFVVLAVYSAFFLLDHILLIHPAKFYFGQGVFLIISLYNFRKIPYYILFLIIILIISIMLPIWLSIATIIPCLLVEHIIIFFIILKRTILYSYQSKKLNVFHFVLLLFGITAITRFIVVLKNLRTGVIFFYITAAFGILIGIFFLFYNEKNSPELVLEREVRDTD